MAVSATPSTEDRRLGVTPRASASAVPRAAVMVTDTGIGLPADQLPHVFERFYRGDAARREADGAGLGLAIARWIADVHGARIDIASEPGAGTRVTMTFPVAV